MVAGSCSPPWPFGAASPTVWRHAAGCCFVLAPLWARGLCHSRGRERAFLDMNIGPLYTPTALCSSPGAVGTRARVGPYVSTDRRKRPASGRKRLA